MELKPYAERLEAGQKARFDAVLQDGLTYAFCAVTQPGGKVVYVRDAQVEARRVVVEFALDAGDGRYQVEYVVAGPYGNQVAANVDVFAGKETETPERPNDDFDERSSQAELARQLFELTNQMRAENGCAPLAWDPTLAPIAQEHAEACARADRLAHVLPDDGGSVADRARRRFGWDVRYGLPGFSARPRAGGPILIGDNLAACANARLAIFLLAESPGHRAALVNPYVEALAIGATRKVQRQGNDLMQGIYFCMVFVQVNDTEVRADLERERRLLDAASEPGGTQVTKARTLEKKGKLPEAVLAYRQFLADYPESSVRDEVQSHLERLIAESGVDLEAHAEKLLERKCHGLLEIARNFQTNHLPHKAIEKLREVLELRPDSDQAQEAARLLKTLSE